MTGPMAWTQPGAPAGSSPVAPVEVSLGRWFFGVAATASGVLQLVLADFVRLVPQPTVWAPAPPALAYLVGVVLLGTGLAIVAGRVARTAATVIGVMLLVVVLLYLPPMVVNPVVDRPFLRGFMWTNLLKALALAGGAAMLAGWLPDHRPTVPAPVRAFGRLAPLGAAFVALFLVVCGLQHFVYSPFVTTLVPSWMPGRSFWTYLTGVALIAGGAGMLFRRTARLAATLSAVMIFLWVLMLHIPRALAGPRHAHETAGVFEALAMSGVALLVAGTAPRARSFGTSSSRGGSDIGS